MAPGADGGGPAPAGSSNREPRWPRALILVGVILMLISGTTFGVGKFLLARYAGGVHEARLLGGAAVDLRATDGLPHARLEGPLTLLLVGSDERADDPAGGARSDSIVIVHVPAGHDRAYLVSVPRDTRVTIPAYLKTGYPGGEDKINAAFEFGYGGAGNRGDGFELVALTLRHLTGIGFNAGAIVNFSGLRSVVDAVGGVELCVDEETTSVHIGYDDTGRVTAPYEQQPPDFQPVPVPGVRPQVYHVGCQSFVGWQALDYVRQRKFLSDGDYGRQRHQQQLIAALAKKISTAGVRTDPLAADRALRALGSAVTFDGNGASLADWIFTLKRVDPGDITMIKTNGGQYNSKVVDGQDFEILSGTTQDLFAAIRDDSVDAFVAAHPDWVVSPHGP